MLASILGVVPFLGTYWACIPAVLELWLAQGQSMLAVTMILAFYIPTSWVNGLVYEEIKGYVILFSACQNHLSINFFLFFL